MCHAPVPCTLHILALSLGIFFGTLWGFSFSFCLKLLAAALHVHAAVQALHMRPGAVRSRPAWLAASRRGRHDRRVCCRWGGAGGRSCHDDSAGGRRPAHLGGGTGRGGRGAEYPCQAGGAWRIWRGLGIPRFVGQRQAAACSPEHAPSPLLAYTESTPYISYVPHAGNSGGRPKRLSVDDKPAANYGVSR